MALPQEVLDQVKTAIAEGEEQLKELEPEIKRAKLAGLDVSEDEERLTQLKAQISKLKQAYGNE